MESLVGRMNHRETSFSDDESVRIRKPPTRGAGIVAEDLGTSGFASKKSQQARKGSATNAKANERVKRDPQKQPINIPDSDSDEIDFLSGQSQSERENPQSPTVIQRKTDVMKTLRFTKKKQSASNVLEPKSPNLSSTFPLSPPRKSSAKKSSQQSSNHAAGKPSGEKTHTRRTRRADSAQSSENEIVEVDPPVLRGHGKQKESVEDPPPPKKERPRPKPKPKPVPSSSSSALFQPPAGKQQPAPASFPVSPDITPKRSFPVLPSPDNTPRNNAFPVSASPVKKVFPVRVEPFPVSPNISSKQSKKLGGNGKESDELPRKLKHKKGAAVPAVAPFPLSLEDSQSTPQAGPSYRCTGRKRTSSGSPEDEDSPSKKRRRDLSSSPPEGLHFDDDDDEEENYFYNPQVDANTLCPYCDEPLPSSPTPHLERLLATTAKKSVRAPRPTNPLGRKAAVGVFINVCQRHRFESELLPEAEEKGWPKSIKWSLIHGRVLKMKYHLEAILENKSRSDDDSDENSDWQIPGPSRKSKKNSTPRDGCVFWEEIITDIKEKGTRVAANVKSQFANFQKTQPGYYGELGSLIIHQSLYELFPPEDMRPDLVSPLSPKEFIDRVLLPEVAVRLIMEDKSLSGSSGARKALQILRDSSSYGVAMFPEDAGEQGDGEGKRKNKSRGKGKGVYQSDEADEDETNKEMNVADQMAMEKARKRRLELEKEDEREQEMIQQEQERAKRELRKGKKKRKEESETEPAVVQAFSLQRPKPKPKPKPKAISRMGSTLSLTDNELGSDLEPGPEHAPSDDQGVSDFDMESPLTPISNANAVPIAEDDDLDDLDAALDNAFIEEDDIGLPPRSTSSPSSRREPEERVCTESDSERATVISSESEMGSNSNARPRRRTRKDKAASARSPSIEMLPPPPPESSEPANPKLRRNNIQPVASLASSSSSSYDRNEGMPGSSLGDWNDNCGLPPLEYMKQRRKFEGAQKKQTRPPI